MIIDPVGYTAQEWTDRVGGILSQYGTIPKLLDERNWRDWANIVCALPYIVGQQPPNQSGYDSWLEWAIVFNQVVRY